METVFDHAITDSEQKTIFGMVFSKDEYLALPMNSDGEYGQIYHLYMLRNDQTTAQKFLDKVKDRRLKADLQQNDIISVSASQPQ